MNVERQTVSPAARRDLEPDVPPPASIETEPLDAVAALAQITRHPRVREHSSRVVGHPAFESERSAFDRHARRVRTSTVQAIGSSGESSRSREAIRDAWYVALCDGMSESLDHAVAAPESVRARLCAPTPVIAHATTTAALIAIATTKASVIQ
jgi:hypothetical protein